MDICSAWCFDMVKLNFINLRRRMEQVPQQSLFFLLDLNFIKSKVKVYRYYREYHFKGREYLELEVFQRRDITSTKVVVIPMIT